MPSYHLTRKANVVRTFVELNIRLIRRTHMATTGKWLSNQFQTLGPTYIKIGQFISSRADIFGQEFSSEFSGLRDHVNPMCPIYSKKLIDEFIEKNPNILEVDPIPMASASIGQVHKAKSKNGSELIVKFKRPNILDEVQADLSFIKMLLDIMIVFRVQNTQATITMIREFEDFLLQEINYSTEKENLMHFYNAYQAKYADFIKIPRAVKGVCTNDVLVMEYIHNTGIENYKGNRSKLACKIMEFFMRQLVQFGFIHGDPHKGNIGITCDDKFILYDFGNMLHISDDDRHLLKELIYMLIIGNKYGVVRILELLGVEIRDVTAVHGYIEKYTEYMRTIDVNVFKGIHKPSDQLPIHLNGKILRILRVYGILEGVCKELDNEFNYFKLLDMELSDLVFDEDFLQYKIKKDMASISKSSEIIFQAFDR